MSPFLCLNTEKEHPKDTLMKHVMTLKEARLQLRVKVDALFLTQAQGGGAAPSPSVPHSPCLLPASVPMRDRHVLPLDSFPASSCPLNSWGRALGFVGRDTGSSRLPPSFHVYTHLHGIWIQWDQCAGAGHPIRSFFLRESSL